MAALRVRILRNRVPDAVQRLFAVHRRAGIHTSARLTSNNGPRLSSAALRAALRPGHARSSGGATRACTHKTRRATLPLFPQKLTFYSAICMSALCQKRS
jgi:hypothetical protein